MAIAQDSTEAQVATIKQALTTPSACSTSIVKSLEWLLNSPREPRSTTTVPNEKSKLSTKAVGILKNTRTAKPEKPTKARSTTKISVLEVLEQEGAGLTPQEKQKLATEVYNLSLKTLSAEIKALAKPTQQPKSQDGKIRRTSTSSRQPLSRAASLSQEPLQILSPNRIPQSPASSISLKRSPTTSALLKRSSSSIVDTLQGRAAIAECASLALSTLRILKGKKGKGDSEGALELDSGVSALVGKLLVLGVTEQAGKDLRAWRKRLEELLKGTGVKKSERMVAEPGVREQERKPTTADLLRFDNVRAEGSLLRSIIAFQGHVLKYIAAERKLSTILEIFDIMTPSNPDSPSALILRSIACKAQPIDKAAQQLQSLALTMWAIASSHSESSNEADHEGRARLRGRIIFRLQALSFELRVAWWKLSGHCYDIESEYWASFLRCLATFAHRQPSPTKEDYQVAKDGLSRVQAAEETLKISNTGRSKAFTSVLKSMAKLARQTGNRLEAADLLGLSVVSSAADTSAVSWTTNQCQLACLRLENRSKTPLLEATIHVQNAANGLKGDLRGSSADLDGLLLEATRLNRVGLLHFSKNIKTSENNLACDPKWEDLCSALINFAQAFPPFLLRYLGDPPDSTDEKILGRYNQRMQRSKPIAISSIEAILLLARSSLNDSSPTWDTIESLLTECITLADRLHSMAQGDMQTSAHAANDKISPHVKLSNIYWARYLQLKQFDSSPIDLWKPLRKAATLLRDRDVPDRVNGFAAVKLERLASTYCDLRRVNEAKETFDEAFQCYADIGVCQKIASKAETQSLHSIWGSDGDQVPGFRRLLASYFELTHVGRGKLSASHFYDDPTLTSEERGILLELQLMTLLTLPEPNAQPESLENVLRTLLAVYDSAEYPLRRLRVVLRILRFSSGGGSVIDPSLISELLAELSDDVRRADGYSKDEGLKGYATYLAGAQILCVFFHGDRTQPEKLDIATSLWSTLVSSDVSELESRIDGLEEVVKQLEIVVDYCDMQGRWFSKLKSLDILCRLYELHGRDKVSPLVNALVRRGLQFSRLGYSDEAENFLAKAQARLGRLEVSVTAKIRWHLAYAEHLLENGNTERCVEYLEAAHGLHDSHIETTSQNAIDNIHEKQSLDRSLSDACYVASLLAFRRGQLVPAMYHAKRCVKLNMRTWAAIEKRARFEENNSESEDNESGMDSVVGSMSKFAIGGDSSFISKSFLRSGRGSSYWSCVPRHYYGLWNLSAISNHFSLFQDAVYYAEQAENLAEALNASALVSLMKSLRGAHWTRAGHIETGQELLQASLSVSGSLEPTKFNVLTHSQWAEACERAGNQVEATRALVKSHQILTMISGSEFLGRHGLVSQNVNLDEAMASLKITDKGFKQQVSSRKKPAPPKGSNRRPDSKIAKRQAAISNSSAATRITSMKQLGGLLLRQKAFSMVDARDPLEATSILAEAGGLAAGQEDRSEHSLLLIRQLLINVMKQLSSHAVYCVLSESTISFPSAKESDNGRSRESSFLSLGTTNFDLSASKSARRDNAISTKSSRTRSPVQEDFSDLLNQILDLLFDTQTAAHKYCSTKALHTLSALHGRISLIAHATRSAVRPLTRPIYTALYIDLGRSLAFHRERSCIQIEKQISDRQSLVRWPELSVPIGTAIQEKTSIDPASFQAKYIDIIPPSWDVISISLGEKKNELVLSKIHAGQTPFFLRLPLRRTNAQDEDEVDFSVDYAKEELLQITKLAHSTSHEARERTESKGKADWWAGREALDLRLKTFLENVEEIWLGGFRGIFCTLDKPAELVSRFSRSLQTILDKHLPSRQKSSKIKHARTHLHSRVLELFIGLGEPKDGLDLEDSLTDLLYFVVDILQFNGEHNAYDEIDFDMIVVETIDALRCYYQELRGLPTEKKSHHTILILDRALHSFPWESLPCLDGVPVSRLPSLGCLRDQLLNQYEHAKSCSSQDFTIDQTEGTYILNPGGDLKNTQKTFSERFESLSNWTAISKRAPSEDEFREALEKRDLFLWFGHGSGEQYIRPRVIRRLDRCAAAFLMGCSSGKLTEAADFEPFGTPWDYMHAGCPALVATLWDVTDKDIDRFALGTFERWGLLDRAAPRETNSRGRTQKRKAETELSCADDQVMALDEAVAKARGECVLRYLNGAAPVIYGIPLYLR